MQLLARKLFMDFEILPEHLTKTISLNKLNFSALWKPSATSFLRVIHCELKQINYFYRYFCL